MDRLTKETQLGPFAALKDEAEAIPGAFASYDCLYAHMLAVTRLKQYEDTGLTPEEVKALIPPPNDPLTLEQLRKMDGEPVWVDFQKCQEANGWMLVSTTRHCVYCGLLGDCDFDNCGMTWLAYLRKPEEGLGFGSVEVAGRT